MRLSAPVAFATALLVTYQPALATPTVFWASDPVGPDQTVLVVGDGLGQVGTVRVWRLPDTPDSAPPPTQGVDVIPVQVSNESLKFTIPKELAQGVFRIALGPDAAASFDLNAPTVYWTQGDIGSASSPDGWLRVFGRNIARTEQAVVRLKPANGGNEVMLRASVTSIWDATFKLPLNIASGAYLARLWNGQGDAGGWRDLGVWHVEVKPAWSVLTLDAKTYGARADGIHDDTPALIGALQVLADKGGGTLLLPRGYYRLSDKLILPERTRLKGEDRTLVRLIWPDFSSPPRALIEGLSNFAIEDITLVASNHAHVISGGFSSELSGDEATQPKNITVRNVTVRATMYRGHLTPDQTNDRLKAALKFSTGGPDTIRLRGRNLVVENCDLYGSGRSLYLERPRWARVARNKFYNGRWGWYSVSGADGVIFEDNDVIGADLQSTGGGVNTLGKLEMFAQNVAFYRNRFAMMMGWDREAVTSDGPGGCYYGPVSSIASDLRTLTLVASPEGAASNLERCVGAGFFVLDGRGMGQVHRVAAVEGNKVQLETPLLSSLNEKTVVSVTSLQRNYLIIGNEFSDAGIAVQLFGASVNEIVADNLSRRTGGFLNRGLFYRQYQPTWYTQFIGNRIAEGDLTKDSILATWGSQKLPNKAPLSLPPYYVRISWMKEHT